MTSFFRLFDDVVPVDGQGFDPSDEPSFDHIRQEDKFPTLDVDTHQGNFGDVVILTEVDAAISSGLFGSH